MDIYKTAISALLIAPIVGGFGIYTLHQYQTLKERAEEVSEQSVKQLQEIEAMLHDEDGAGTSGYVYGELTLDDTECSVEDIAEEVIRFHIRANSDSEQDQALKQLVRDAILEELEPKLAEAESREEAETIMEEQLSEIEAIGIRVMKEAGYDYEIHAYLTEEEFPMKDYGDLRFPAGEYEALRVDIGEKNGGNWWCVMYPGLCFVDTAGGVVAADGKEELQRVLTPEEYEEILICPSEDTQIEYRSLLWDILFEKE